MVTVSNDTIVEDSLSEFINSNEVVQTYRFFVYGLPNEEEISLLARGLFFQFEKLPVKGEAIVTAEEIDENKAVAFNLFRGAVLTFAFATKEDMEDMVKGIILDGLDYLRYKVDYLGAKEVESNV
ncbi:MAG: hypothetical protein CM15mV62_470 [uncultured marine virus]|nr:MAG: hypothetical protein CM15mV62_470 [uncultured marine virus]